MLHKKPKEISDTISDAVYAQLPERVKIWIDRCLVMQKRVYEFAPEFTPDWKETWRLMQFVRMIFHDLKKRVPDNVMSETNLSDLEVQEDMMIAELVVTFFLLPRFYDSKYCMSEFAHYSLRKTVESL